MFIIPKLLKLMLKESALNTTIALASLFATYASAAVHKYDGTMPDLALMSGVKKLVDMTVAVEVVQTGS